MEDTIIHDIFITYDSEYGGFKTGKKYKYLEPANILYLLKNYDKTRDIHAITIAEHTLQSMYKGGIYDHIGYGFYEYSLDNKWFEPNFRKNLFDNAFMAYIYGYTYKLTNNKIYLKIANEIIYFILDKLEQRSGVLSSSYKIEKSDENYYLLSYDEIINLFGNSMGEEFCEIFNITKSGNFKKNKNIPYLTDINLVEINSSIDSMVDMTRDYIELKQNIKIDESINISWNNLTAIMMIYIGDLSEEDFFIRKGEEILNNMNNACQELYDIDEIEEKDNKFNEFLINGITLSLGYIMLENTDLSIEIIDLLIDKLNLSKKNVDKLKRITFECNYNYSIKMILKYTLKKIYKKTGQDKYIKIFNLIK